MKIITIAFMTGLFACGPSTTPGDDVDGNGTIDSPIEGGAGSISGTVWAPGYGPDFVGPGYEMPVPGALVYLSLSSPPAIPQYAHCEECVSTPGSSTFTDPKGNFLLAGIVPGEYVLVIQKGQFRLEQTVVVPEGRLDLASLRTTLPNTHDPANGQWLPKMALATGSYDDLEDIFGKMGIGGSSDSNGRYVPSADGGSPDSQLHFYTNGGRSDMQMSGSLTTLVSDLERMKQYHIILIPCAGTENTAALRVQQNLRNIRDYVAAGGKFYVADWSAEWADNVFPAQIRLGGGDTPASAYDAGTDAWNTSQFGGGNGSSYTSNNAEAVSETVNAWLDGQVAPQISGADGPIDADNFSIAGNWNTMEELTDVQVGVDDEGIPIFDSPNAIIIGGRGTDLPKKPLTVSYQPAGCGRVVFTTYHTAHGILDPGLYPQERLLSYLIMEIGECVDTPIID